jgi:hypothetical protein
MKKIWKVLVGGVLVALVVAFAASGCGSGTTTENRAEQIEEAESEDQ